MVTDMRELMSWDEFLMLGNRQSGTQTVELQTVELQQETGCSCIHCDWHNIYLKYCIMYSPSSEGSHMGSHYEYNCVKCVNSSRDMLIFRFPNFGVIFRFSPLKP